MSVNTRFTGTAPSVLESLFQQAVNRYMRNDLYGASNTIFNASRSICPKNKQDGSFKYNLYKLEPLEGSIEDVCKAYSEDNILKTLRILKYIELQFHFGKYVA